MNQNEPGLRWDGLVQCFDPVLQEEHHGGVIVFSAAIRAANSAAVFALALCIANSFACLSIPCAARASFFA